MKLTENFTLAEMTRSDYAARHGLDNSPCPEHVVNLTKLAMVMEKIRLACGGPVIVTSGYRSTEVNVGVGGSATSAHCRGMAADFTVVGQPPKRTAKIIASMVKDLSVDQVILEFGAWVHVGIADKPRHQVLTAIRHSGETVYLRGIV